MKFKLNWRFVLFLVTLAFLIGFATSMIMIGLMAKATITEAVANIKIENIQIGFNETYMMDRMDKILKESFWQNGTAINYTCKGIIGGKNDVCL